MKRSIFAVSLILTGAMGFAVAGDGPAQSGPAKLVTVDPLLNSIYFGTGAYEDLDPGVDSAPFDGATVVNCTNFEADPSKYGTDLSVIRVEIYNGAGALTCEAEDTLAGPDRTVTFATDNVVTLVDEVDLACTGDVRQGSIRVLATRTNHAKILCNAQVIDTADTTATVSTAQVPVYAYAIPLERVRKAKFQKVVPTP